MRGQIRQLEDRYAACDGDLSALEKAIIALSLKFQVLCRFTAYVAVDGSRAINQNGPLHRVTQPVELPTGWDTARKIGVVRSASLGRNVRMLHSQELRRDELMPPCPAPESRMHSTDEDDTMKCSFLTQRQSHHDDLSYRDEIVIPAGNECAPDATTGPITLPERFQHGEVIGEGAMGRVYKAFDRDRGMPVCVKVGSLGRLGPEGLERWRRENEVLQKLGHRALTPALEIGCSDESYWVVMPVINGQTLNERLRLGGPLPFREAAALVAELADALRLAHEAGLAHGDLKPAYISLGDDGQARLIGFGELPLRAGDSRPRAPHRHAGLHAPRAQFAARSRSATLEAKCTPWVWSCTKA